MSIFINFLNDYLGEMAQSLRDEGRGIIKPDEADRDFIQQAKEAGTKVGRDISDRKAIEVRYTTLLKNKTGDNPADINFGKPDKPIILRIERPRYSELVKKLQDVGLTQAAEHGLELNAMDLTNFFKRDGWVVNHKKPSKYRQELDKNFGYTATHDIIGKGWEDNANYEANMIDVGHKAVEKLVGTQIDPEVWKIYQEKVKENSSLPKSIMGIVTYHIGKAMTDKEILKDPMEASAWFTQILAGVLVRGNQPQKDDPTKKCIESKGWILAQAREQGRYVLRDWDNGKRVKKHGNEYSGDIKGSSGDSVSQVDYAMNKKAEKDAQTWKPTDNEPEEEMPTPTPPHQPAQAGMGDFDTWMKQQDKGDVAADKKDLLAFRKKSSIGAAPKVDLAALRAKIMAKK